MAPSKLDREGIALRRRNALELRRAGATWDEIAERTGYASKGAACKDISRALEGLVRRPAEAYVNEELDRLDAMLTGLWPKARRGDVRSVDAVLRIMDRRARYLGLDTFGQESPEAGAGDGRVIVVFATAPPGTAPSVEGANPATPALPPVPPVIDLEPDDAGVYTS